MASLGSPLITVSSPANPQGLPDRDLRQGVAVSCSCPGERLYRGLRAEGWPGGQQERRTQQQSGVRKGLVGCLLLKDVWTHSP